MSVLKYVIILYFNNLFFSPSHFLLLLGLLEFPVYDSPTCQADDTVWAENNLYKSTKGSTKASGNRLEPGVR